MKRVPAFLLTIGAILAAVCAPAAFAAKGDDPPPPTAGVAQPAQTISPEKQEEIRHLLRITGAAKTAMQTIAETAESEKKKADSSIPPEFWDRFLAKVKEKDIEDIIIPVYDRHFTLDEIKGLVAFYDSPLGKKMASLETTLVKESGEAGEKLGEAKGQEVVREMMAEQGKTNPNKTPDKAPGK